MEKTQDVSPSSAALADREYSGRSQHLYKIREVFLDAIIRMYTDYSSVPIQVKTQIRKQRIEVKKMFGLLIPKQPADVRSKHPND